QFDRMQQQKLRRPNTVEEEAKEIARRLQELADSEDFVYATLAGIVERDAPATDAKAQDGEGSAGKPEKPSDDGTKDGELRDSSDQESIATDKPPTERGKEPAAEREQPGDKPQSSGDDATGTADGRKMAGLRAVLEELQDRQLDAALEAREVEKALEKMKKATDLAKARMAEAAKSSEDASAALEQGDGKTAQAAAGEAKTKFRELADQVKALLAQEQAERIAAAQQMAADLARRQQEFQDELANANLPNQAPGQGRPNDERPEEQPKAGDKGQAAGDEPNAATVAEAQRIADKAETLNDVLAAAAKADSPEDQSSAKKVEELMGSLDLKALAARLADLPDQVRDGKLEDARNMAGDGAERMEVAAAQLAALRRAIVAPKVDELAKLEAESAGLDERLDRLDTDARVTGWHVDADELLARLDEAGIDEKLRDEFVEEMKQAGWGPELRLRGWNWARNEGGYYLAPATYRRLLTRLSTSLRARMQELMLGDLSASGDEPIPPQYQDLVDRYYQILASEKQDHPRADVPKVPLQRP
ncbi:MAG TPA: hypothetical protein VGX76_25225, partial [Pirellulales bacterium]|nr:hypothetical protein [Pirellulales bacterium]